jgi:hypothetical protein
MFASLDTYPSTLPPGFSFVEEEDVFDPARHLQLERPDRVFTLAELGYGEEEAGQYPSPIAATGVVRLLSDEGVQALRRSIEAVMPRTVKTRAGDPRLYYGAYQSKFMRDLAGSEELTAFLSELYGTPIAPHTMASLGIQLNIGTQPEVEIQAWHHDSVSFTVVLSMYDPTKIEGGRFEYFDGTREEGKRLWDDNGVVPPERCVSPKCPPGYAGTIQGSAVWHRGAPLLSEGYRASLVLSFVARDASYPDGNRAFFVDYEAVPFAGAQGVINPIPVEWARHNAWLAQARIATLLEELPWTEDMDWLAEQLRRAIAPIERAVERLEAGIIPMDAWKAVYDRDDVIQMTQPRFQPESERQRTTASS